MDIKPTPMQLHQSLKSPSRPRASTSQTPSLNAILSAYKKDGGGDRDLLVALLESKRREDERLASAHALEIEVLRAQNLHYAYYFAMSQNHAFAPAPPAAHQRPSKPMPSFSRSPSVASSASLRTSSSSTPPSPKQMKRKRGTVTRDEALQALRGKLARPTPAPLPRLIKKERNDDHEDQLEDGEADGEGESDEDQSSIDERGPLTPPMDVSMAQRRRAGRGKGLEMLLDAVELQSSGRTGRC